MKHLVQLIFLITVCNLHGQFSFEGKVETSTKNKTVYLSIIEDYRKLSRTYLEQIIKKTTADSLGFFKFEGKNLLSENRIYRIHVDECPDMEKDSNHFFGQCSNTKSILFIANNLDTIVFPETSGQEVLCDITSTNPKSDALLQIDAMKEEMAYDFADYRSEANRKLNSKKWFSTFQEYGKTIEEPLVELYIYDFLSDRRNETYDYYLHDLSNNLYYDELLERLNATHSNTFFTHLYETELTADKQLVSFKNPSFINWKWVLGLLLGLSLILNIVLFVKQRKYGKRKKDYSLEKLTQQEQKIVAQILDNKTNKEIAADMFISLSTVKSHINNLYKKLNATTREDIKRIFS